MPDVPADPFAVPGTDAGFSAVLLAGGQSSRMGKNKAGVLWDGQPLWERQLATLRRLAPREILISGTRDGPYAASGVTIASDLTPGCGPLSGLEATLVQAGHPLVVVLAIDLPAMTPDFLGVLLREARERGRGVVPRVDGYFEPLAAVYPRECLRLVRACLAGSDFSMRKFVSAAIEQGLVIVRDVTAEEAGLFRNVNAPEDLP